MGIRIGTDYFSLATTGDVLMNGVKALGYSAAISIALAAAFSIRSTIVWKKRLKETIKSRHSRDIRLTLLAFHYRRDFMNELFPFTASIFAILTISIAVFFASQPSGLYYVGGADLPQECKYQQAEWIGAQSSIINCQGTPWVIRDGENVRYLKPQKVCRLRLKLWQACEYVGLPRAPNERTATMANPIGRD